MEEMIKFFNIKKISKSPAMFDVDKLMYLSGYYLHLNWQKHLPDILFFVKNKPLPPKNSLK